jgi:uncharacterized protein (DUF697 family)
MNPAEIDSLLTIGLAAAFADGTQSEAETARIRAMLPVPDPEALIARVRSGQADLAGAAAGLGTAERKQEAYEFAVCVVESDGHRNESEAAFLSQLETLLGLGAGAAQSVLAQADAINLPPAAVVPAAAPDNAEEGSGTETLIRNTAILAGALELLPQKLASLAIIPLQTSLVYRVGKRHGVALDSGHVKEFLAVAGIGMSSQMLENVARRFLGGFVRSLAGGVAGGVTRGATGPVLSFATTYALGWLAEQYYAGGRKLSALQLKETFGRMLADATEMGEKFTPQMQDQAKNLDLAQLPKLLAGKA